MPPLLDNVAVSSLTPIQKFYSGLNVFVTGGTGFVGQLVVEKLLRSCPDIGNVYLLIRGKKNKNMVTRIDELLDGAIFDKVKEVCPKYKYKVIGVEGECGLPNLGLNEQDRKLLTTEVSVVFHGAATVNFDEKLTRAVDINIKGTRTLMDLCKEMTRLKAVVHISTAYTNCVEEVIEEKFYPAAMEPKKLITLAEILDESLADKLTPDLIGERPNTYAYTKAVAENLIQEEGKSIPMAVYRPSIIISTYKEPLAGWTNNLYGPVGVTAAAGAGILRALNCDPTVNANMVPGDMCVNALLAIPWDICDRYSETQRNNQPWDIPIYQYESSEDQPINWARYMDLCSKNGLLNPSNNAVWSYSLALIKNIHLYQLAILFYHLIPAFVLDSILFLLGKKPRFVTIYSKIHRFSKVISYFNTKNFKFKSTRVREMITKMSPKDQDIFFCDLKKLNWDDYFKMHYIGIRTYLLKEPMSTLPQALKRYRRFYWCNQALKGIVGYILIRLVWTILFYIYNVVI